MRLRSGALADAFLAKYPEFQEQNRLDVIVPCVVKHPFAKLDFLDPPVGQSNGKCSLEREPKVFQTHQTAISGSRQYILHRRGCSR